MSTKPGTNNDRAENELLLCCARTTISKDTAERIHTLIRHPVGWGFLVQSAIHHRVVPLLYLNLKRICPDFIPTQYLEQLQYHYENNAKRNLFLTFELIKLIELLETANISAIPYKGPAIAFLAYGNICLRQFSDLDILVQHCDYLKTRHFLIECGYQLKADYGWECSLVDDRHGVCVDLHKGITPEQFPTRLDLQSLQQSLKPLPFVGGKINTPCPEDMLIILCIQLAKDAWGYNPLRLSKICDIAELLRTYHEMDWKKVLKETRRMGCQRILLVGLSIANKLLGAPLPELPLKSLTDPSFSILTNHIYNKLIQQIAPGHGGQLSMKSFHFKIRERWRDKLYSEYHDFKLRLIPNERDYEFLTLPKSLNILYYVIRPIRLACDYGRLFSKR